jgi:hypothetical protein
MHREEARVATSVVVGEAIFERPGLEGGEETDAPELLGRLS